MAAALELVKQRIDEVDTKISDRESEMYKNTVNIPLYVIGLDRFKK